MFIADVDCLRVRVAVDGIARDLQCENGLTNSKGATEHHELTRAEPAVQHVIQWWQAGG